MLLLKNIWREWIKLLIVNLIVKEAADSDVAEILTYLVFNHAKSAAERFKNSFRTKYKDITLFPDAGMKVRVKRLRHYLFVIVEKYYVFYTFKNYLVTIERVLHTARNYKAILGKQG